MSPTKIQREGEGEPVGALDAQGNQRIEEQEPGPPPKTSAKVRTREDKTTGESESEAYVPARSAPGGEQSPNPIIDPDDPYNHDSDSGSGEAGTTIIGAGTTSKKTSARSIGKSVTLPPTGETETGDLHPAGDTKTTTAEDPIDASDSVAAGQSHPVPTDYFGDLEERHRRDRPKGRGARSDKYTSGASTATGSKPQLGETITVWVEGIAPDDSVWLRVKGPDQETRQKAAIEGTKASGAVLITRPGDYEIAFEVNGDVVESVEFTV